MRWQRLDDSSNARRVRLLPPLVLATCIAAVGALLSWSFSTIAVAAKNLMASVPDFLLIETAFTIVQWVIVGPLTALAFSGLGAGAPGRPAAA